MDDRKRRPFPLLPDDRTAPAREENRRQARIVHDERGNARVEWQKIPAEGVAQPERVPLSIEDDPRGPPRRVQRSWRATQGFNPYDRVGKVGLAPEPERPKKRDLRKLSDWLKLKREIEERKARGED